LERTIQIGLGESGKFGVVGEDPPGALDKNERGERTPQTITNHTRDEWTKDALDAKLRDSGQ